MTMKTIKGPAVFLAQFAADDPPYDSLPSLAKWAQQKGFKGVQIPTWDTRLIDIKRAAESETYASEIKGLLADHDLTLTEFASHITGQLVAVHPAHDQIMDSFAPDHVRGSPTARRAWAEEQLRLAARASNRLGITTHTTFSGALLHKSAERRVSPFPGRTYPTASVTGMPSAV